MVEKYREGGAAECVICYNDEALRGSDPVNVVVGCIFWINELVCLGGDFVELLIIRVIGDESFPVGDFHGSNVRRCFFIKNSTV